ncbi:MAG: sulfatase [Verrucomicrobiales bacterium]|nr:sulfatase [Verrucomicrobiales bacterium]
MKNSVLFILFLLTISFAGADDKKPNILFCIADDWGAHASIYGDPVVKTPNFDRIAKEGALFHNAYVSSPSCTPCRNSILTGQWHWRLGPGANLYGTLRQDLQVYPHLLAEAGYHTGSWRKSFGPGKLEGKFLENHPAGKPGKGFDEFLENRPESAPFCFWLGASDPHRAYKPGTGKESGMDLSKIELFPCFPDSEEVRSDVADYYFEVERFDSDVGKAIAKLEAIGELDNTIIVVTGDHGMPFPRCKSNLYDSGTRVPLAIRWGDKVKAGQEFKKYASLIDLAPTFLDACGVEIPGEMTGRSLLPALTGGGDAALRAFILTGKERHVPSQEAPDMGGYPSRALRTDNFLYIRNYQTSRWPNGTPNWQKAAMPGNWYADTDNGPTKTYIIDNQDKDDAHRMSYALCFDKRPAEELYDLSNDPDQLVNVAGEEKYSDQLLQLSAHLSEELIAGGDPRHVESLTYDFDAQPYGGGGPKAPGYQGPKKPKKKKAKAN